MIRNKSVAASMIALSVAVWLTTGCAQGDSANKNEVQEIIQVQISSIPEKPLPGQPVRIEARITQAGEPVDDAKKVEFEIWQRGQKNHDTVKGEHRTDGVYDMEQTFEAAGIYYVIAHCSGRNMHNMPRKQLIVGNVSAAEIAEAAARPDKSTYKH
ncbi:FixH family protein [Cohnella soli]|uniref:FixH family protein n=1 Tax=Cohnella soli TaxID=425005 RepID=A0ABW0I5M0_9BACL